MPLDVAAAKQSCAVTGLPEAEMMTVLVTGTGGFVGSASALTLKERGHGAVFALHQLDTGEPRSTCSCSTEQLLRRSAPSARQDGLLTRKRRVSRSISQCENLAGGYCSCLIAKSCPEHQT